MESDIIRILLTIAIAWGLYALNEALNSVPKLKQVLAIVIILVGLLFLIAPVVDVFNIALGSVNNRRG